MSISVAQSASRRTDKNRQLIKIDTKEERDRKREGDYANQHQLLSKPKSSLTVTALFFFFFFLFFFSLSLSLPTPLCVFLSHWRIDLNKDADWMKPGVQPCTSHWIIVVSY